VSESIGRPSERFVTLARTVLAPLARFFHRPTLEGVENLPKDGPFLLVANHSGGTGVAEISCFISLYLEKVGADRPLAGFAHPFGFGVWPLSMFMRHAGAVPSTYEAGARALAAGVPLLVFPGGDHEVFRPVWQASRVDFAGRVGFLKMARAAGVRIVPMGFRGSHVTAPILWRSRYVLPYVAIWPRLIKVKRYPLTLLGALLAGAAIAWLPALGAWRFFVAWFAIASPFTLIPWIPSTIRIRIGSPISAEELFAGEAGDAQLRAALARVQAAVQALVKR
jgi:1-acyl-sn-glycerol-3-phosphate acyltransferase